MRKFFTLFSFLMLFGQMSYSQCATLSSATVSLISGSGNGTAGNPFSCGSVVRYCVTVTSYAQGATNWLHGVSVGGFPAGSTVSAGTPTPTGGGGTGTWVWSTSLAGVPGSNLPNYGPGWFYDTTDTGTDPGNNFGVNCTNCNITFCFNVTLPPAPCTMQTYNPVVYVTGDGVTGSWTDLACDDDPVTPSGWANQVLPIELKAIKAHNEGNQNLITWTTASESNNDVQMVERSIDGKSGWEMVGKVAGTNKSQEVTYEVIDENPLNISYYRLHSIDFDGREQFSKIVSVRRDGIKGGRINAIYPNPATHQLTADLQSDTDGDAVITISDITGKVMTTSKIYLKEGINNHQSDLTSLPSGMYILKVEGAGINEFKKFVKE